MKILITGSHGLVGQACAHYFKSKNFEVVGLPRGEWSSALLENANVLINLAGENIADGRWTPDKKKRIYDSRVVGTRKLASAIEQLKSPPSVVLSASAIGIYGNRGDEILTEHSSVGEGFLAEVGEAWENAINSLQQKKISRVVNLRFGMILSNEGGALPKMMVPFKLGAGAVLGNGKQWMSWIHLDDVVRGIEFLIQNKNVTGPVNMVAPEAATNQVFSKVLGKALHRPVLLKAPAFALKLMMGEMAEELLLSSQRVVPSKLQEAGYSFIFPQLLRAFKF